MKLILYTASRAFALFGVCCALCFGSAYAATLDEARMLFDTGNYDAAIDMAIALDTPESLTLAAETLSAKVMLERVDDPVDEARQARRWAEAALEQTPDSHNAQLQYALAYGFETRASSPMRAWRKGLIKKSRDAIEAYRTNVPDDPRGDALLAAWHLGIVRRLDEDRAMDWFGASKPEGFKLYRDAVTAAPEDIIMAGNFAVTLLSLDIEAHRSEAFGIISNMATLEPRNALERDVKDMILILPYYKTDKLLQKRVNELME